MTKFTDLFDPCSSSFDARLDSSTAKMSAPQMWRFAAPAGIRECLANKAGLTFSSRDVFEAVPEINQLYDSPRTLGDRLGQGVAGSTGHGLGLHQVSKGQHVRCRENATLFILGACCRDFPHQRQRMEAGESPEEIQATAELDPEVFEELVATAGFDSDRALAEAIRGIPSLSDLGIRVKFSDGNAAGSSSDVA